MSEHYSIGCLSFRYSESRDVVYRTLDFMADEGQRAGDDGSYWNRYWIKRIGKGKGSKRILLSRWKRLKMWESLTNKHYSMINISFNGKWKSVQIHRIILTAFAGACPNGKQCRHLNGKKWDNHLVNLKWGTSEEQHQDRNRHGTGASVFTRGERNAMAKLKEADVKYIRKALQECKITRREAAELYGVSTGTIDDLAVGKTWKHI